MGSRNLWFQSKLLLAVGKKLQHDNCLAGLEGNQYSLEQNDGGKIGMDSPGEKYDLIENTGLGRTNDKSK